MHTHTHTKEKSSGILSLHVKQQMLCNFLKTHSTHDYTHTDKHTYPSNMCTLYLDMGPSDYAPDQVVPWLISIPNMAKSYSVA